MPEETTVLVVDDDPFCRDLIARTLGDAYRTICFEDAEHALARAAEEPPAAILLDVELPGRDGYEACRRLRAEGATATIPVVFVSAHDGIEDRLRGYEAGGNDYVLKPFEPKELRAKLARLLECASERHRLQGCADLAGRTAMTAMTAMGELGALLQALKKFNVCNDFDDLAAAVLEGLASYGLQGATQVRHPGGAVTRSSRGAATPLEASVIGRMAEMERIVEFRTHMAITYDHLSIVVTDMPTHDDERCGRLRDHLAMLTESAAARARAIAAGRDSERRGHALDYAIQEVSRALREIDDKQRHQHVADGIAAADMTTRMERAYVSAGLSEQQEILLSRAVQEGVESILNTQLANADLQDRLTEVIGRMQAVLDGR